MHGKPSRTVGNVLHTVLYDAIFLPYGTACADVNCAGVTRAMYKKPIILEGSGETFMRSREHPADIDRQRL